MRDVSYRRDLPNVFPHRYVMAAYVVAHRVETLLGHGWAELPQSSFAVTADAGDGYLTLWLSEVSHRRLLDRRLLAPGEDEDLGGETPCA